MTKKKSDMKDAEDLQAMGFELRAPQDGFSYQPDSGGAMGGILGKQEYGIDDAETSIVRSNDELPTDNNPLTPVPGESQWSQEHRRPVEELAEGQSNIQFSDIELLTLVQDRLFNHPNLVSGNLDIRVEKSRVHVRGSVGSSAGKLLIDEIIQALPGVAEIDNQVKIDS